MAKKNKSEQDQGSENEYRIPSPLALIAAIVSGIVVTGFAAFTAIFWYMINDIDGDVRAVREQTDKIADLQVLITEIHTNTANTKSDVANLEVRTKELGDTTTAINLELAGLPEQWKADVTEQIESLETGVLDVNSKLAESVGVRINDIEVNTSSIDILRSELQQIAMKVASSGDGQNQGYASQNLDEEAVSKYQVMLEEMKSAHSETKTLTADFRKLCTNITRSDARHVVAKSQGPMAQYVSQFRQTQLGEHVRFHKGCLGPTLVVDLNRSFLNSDQASLLNRLTETENITVLFPPD